MAVGITGCGTWRRHEQLAEQTRGREQFASAHREEMAQRQHALAAEISLQRLIQAGRIADVLVTIARAAHVETLEPPLPAAWSQRVTLIPSTDSRMGRRSVAE
jgi:hypothetical protein